MYSLLNPYIKLIPIKKSLITIVFLLFSQVGLSQTAKIDSLSKESFDTLEEYLDKNYVDSVNDIIYAKAYLKKAIKLRDTIKIAAAYYYLSNASRLEQALHYSDSIINITKHLQANKKYPGSGYHQKGNLYYKAGKYKEALDCYLACYELSLKSGSQTQALVAKQNIGLLKNKVGEREEALKIFRDCINYTQESDIENKDYYLVRGFYCLADSYVYNNKRDSAALTIKKGIQKAIQFDDSLMYAHYIYLSGVNAYFSKNYKVAIDSIKKSNRIFYEETLNAVSNLYLGKSYFALNKGDSAIFYFDKVDNFLEKTENVTSELIEIYPRLIEIQREDQNLGRQLYYTNRLLKFDSILSDNSKYLSKNIAKKYDIHELVESKNQIIKELEGENETSKKYNYILIVIAAILLVLAILYIQKNVSNKRKYNMLMATLKQGKSESTTDESVKTIKNSEVSEQLVEEILLALKEFEASNRFIDEKFTLNSLAKEINTNSTYLSKVINMTKQTSFAHYLNNLKVDFAIDKLSSDKQFRSFTIKAIAESTGFNTAQSFTTAFYKKTGIYPSYFIRQLNNDKFHK